MTEPRQFEPVPDSTTTVMDLKLPTGESVNVIISTKEFDEKVLPILKTREALFQQKSTDHD